MKEARVRVNSVAAGELIYVDDKYYRFYYYPDYSGPPVSLTMPVRLQDYEFNKFPPFFEGLLPEGTMLEALLRKYKINKNDFFEQLIRVGSDVVGAVTIERKA